MDRDPARAPSFPPHPSASVRSAWTRRGVLRLGAGLAVAAGGLLAACTAAPASPASSSSPTLAPAAAARPAQPTGELKLAIDGEFPATLDATKNRNQLVRL